MNHHHWERPHFQKLPLQKMVTRPKMVLPEAQQFLEISGKQVILLEVKENTVESTLGNKINGNQTYHTATSSITTTTIMAF
mmetsp:Transcript_19582/g.40605  ORF Transcript_19582/g.40605 Transcript_19582/m.40605 type:complete len:81 (+) Transcript_19582:3424-3666(+)